MIILFFQKLFFQDLEVINQQFQVVNCVHFKSFNSLVHHQLDLKIKINKINFNYLSNEFFKEQRILMKIKNINNLFPKDKEV